MAGRRHHPARQGPGSRIAVPCGGLPLGVEISQVPASRMPSSARSGPSCSHLAEAVDRRLLVTFISLGMRTGMVVAISIPLVLAATFLAMDLFNVGLHKVSLGALVLASASWWTMRSSPSR
jgi:multidrug efflux pump